MDSEKKSVNIPWLKVIGQGYIGGIAILIAFSWKFLLGLLVVAVGYFFIDGRTSEGRDSWVDLDLALRGLIGLFALSTFITVIFLFHMLFSYKIWARIAVSTGSR